MTRNQRLIPLALATIVAVVALVVIPGNADNDDEPATTSPPERTATDTRPTPAAPPAPRVERIRLRDGRPVGGVRTLTYDTREVIRLRISSNVDDEIHVHGYDRTVRVPAEQTRRLRLQADAEGIFEIESHNTHQPVARLEVRP